MDFRPSVRDDQRDTFLLAPWYLNCLNQYSGGNPTKFILKHEIFGRLPMNAFKANLEKYKKYVDLKGSQEYTEIVDPIVNLLTSMRLIQISKSNSSLIAITPLGINRCNEPLGEGSWNQIYYTIKDNDEIAHNPGYAKYKK